MNATRIGATATAGPSAMRPGATPATTTTKTPGMGATISQAAAGPEYRDHSGAERGWERTALGAGHGYDDSRRDFGGWDAPWGGHPGSRRDDGWDRPRQEARSFLDKTRDELASLFGGGRRDEERRPAEERYAARDGQFRGVGPKGYRRSDERIREEINDRLTDDAWLDASDIEVEVRDGEATLSGIVRARADKRRAEDLVERVSGVSHVQNNLRLDADRAGRTDPSRTPPMI
jgi:osmotically-inducible protein OsmY